MANSQIWVACWSAGTVYAIDAVAYTKIGPFTVGTNPVAMFGGSDNNLWVVNSGSNSVSRVTPAGVVTNYAVGGGSSVPQDNCLGSDGNIWVANPGTNNVSKVTTAGVVTNYAVGSGPQAICLGGDTNVWTANYGAASVSKVTPAGTVTSYSPLPAEPNAICLGGDGNVWTANFGAGSVSKVTPSGTITSYNVGSQPIAICLGGDGNVWVVNTGGNSVSKVTPSGAVSTYTVGSDPQAICLGGDGNVWVANAESNYISKVTPSGSVTNYTVGSDPNSWNVCLGTDGNVWIAEQEANQLTKITPGGTVTQYNVGSGPFAVCPLVAYNAPPAPVLGPPATATYEDLSGTPTFAWTPAGGQTGYSLREKIAGAGSYNYWNNGTQAFQSGSAYYNTGGLGSVTFPAAAWANGNIYNWSVSMANASGDGIFATDYVVTGQAGPTVTISTPTGSIAQSNPVVNWSSTYPGGATQIAYQVRTFSAAQYGVGGFNPATSTATDDTGVVASVSLSYQIATPLPSASYRSYVQVTETGPQGSAWAHTSFTTVVDEPATPTLTASVTTDPATGCPVVDLTVQGDDNLLSVNDASFETNIGTWTGTNCTLAQSATKALDGSYSLQMTANTTLGTMSATTGQYAVTPSTVFSLMASFIPGTTSRLVKVAINWYTAASGFISTSTGSGVLEATGASWTQAVETATSPSNAAFATATVTVTAPANTEIHYVDEVGLMPGTDSTWTVGGLSGFTGAVILRSDGLYVRNASPANPLMILFPSELVSVYDYEVAPGVAYTYTATLTANLGGGTILNSAATAATGAQTVTTFGWWFLNPLTPSGAVSPAVLSPVISQTEQSAVHFPIGQGGNLTFPTVVSSGFNGLDGTATLQTYTAATYASVVALLISGQTAFISSPFGVGYYVRMGPQPGGMSSGTGNKARVAALLPSTSTAPVQSIAMSWIAQPRPST